MMVPLSGAMICVCLRRSNWLSKPALAAARRALAICSALSIWLICWALKALSFCRARARSAFIRASLAAACASASWARANATSACTLSADNCASNWPACTTSPTLAIRSAMRKPPTSAETLASCHAATLPLATKVKGSMVFCTRVVLTVKAGLAAGCACTACAPDTASPQSSRPICKQRPAAGRAGARCKRKKNRESGKCIRLNFQS